MAKNCRGTRKKRTKKRRCQMISIDVLPDDVLLGIFDFCVDQDADRGLFPQSTKQQIEAWQSLVHVCRRWRTLVFGSSRRLNLRLVCTTKTPVGETVDVWPAFPLLIRDYDCLTGGVDNIIAVLECRDRVCEIYLKNATSSHLERVSAAMQEPFPELTSLLFHSYHVNVPVLPDSFLGGSAPLLQSLYLDRVPYPGLPTLLLSTPHLVHLRLWSISHSGYFSPEAMLTALPTLTSLESLWLQFESPRSRPDRERRRLHRTPFVLPVLASFGFKGVCEYLEDLVARIDAPQLNTLHITFFNQITFDTPQLIQFISRTSTLNTPEKAQVAFGDYHTRVRLSSQTSGHGALSVGVACRELDWQLSSLEQVCTSCLPLLSTLEDLYIYQAPFSRPNWKDNVEYMLWLELLHPFISVKNLYLSEEFAPRIVPALQELIGGSTTEVLPTLHNVFLEGPQPSGPVQEGIGQFVATRQVTGRLIGVSHWDNSEQDKQDKVL